MIKQTVILLFILITLSCNHKENDFGIDAFIDVIAEFGQVTGKTIAAQVKTGSSYFKEKNECLILKANVKYLRQIVPSRN